VRSLEINLINREHMTDNSEILEINGITKKYGGLIAVDNISLNVNLGEILGIIGPNGAGKTTLFGMITNFIRPSSGKVYFQGRDITESSPDLITKLGIARTFQNIRIFSGLTALENVMVAAQLRRGYSLATTLLCLPSFFRKEKEIRLHAQEVMQFLHIERLANLEAGSLTHAMQRRLELARALASDPKILLLDEPAGGLNATEIGDLLEDIRSIRDQLHITVVLVEHVMGLVMNLCERIAVLNYGRLIAIGTCTEIQENPSVIEAYLGVTEPVG